MIHSASFLATGSMMTASAWVASAGLCLRTRSMTFSSASVSACEVDDVVAKAAAGGGGLRAGGNAACWRVAGARAGAAGALVAAGAVVLSAVFGAGAVLGTARAAVGRGFGHWTFFGGAPASPAHR